MRRFFCIILTFVLTVGCFSTNLFAANDKIETKYMVKTDSVSEAVMQAGLYMDEKVEELDTFMDGARAINEVIEDNSLMYSDGEENSLFVGNCVIVGTEQDIAFDTSAVITAIRYDDMYYIQYETVQAAKTAVEIFLTYPTVNYAEIDSVVVLDDPPLSVADSETSQDVNGYTHLSWGVSHMDLDIFADYVSRTVDGSCTVAVVDTGVNGTHPFLQGRVLSNGHDFVNNDNDPTDDRGHGTHVAGTIVDGTPGLDVNILPIKVLASDGRGTSSNVALGIRYAADSGADVINLSLGGGHMSVKDAAIDYALALGVTVVASAGNEYVNTEQRCPAHMSDIIVTAAIDSANNNMHGFNFYGEEYGSNYGTSVDITAPGVWIRSCALNSGYEVKDGTSMAAPHISAAVAMLKILYPDASSGEIENMLKSCALDLGDDGYDVTYGAGVPVLSKLITTLPFDDVATSDWYYEAIFENYIRGYMTGKSTNSFMPAENMKRQDVAVLFYHIAGEPAVMYRDIYDDVTSDAYYANAAVWAYDNGIITGLQNGCLGVDADILRQDFAVILYRYANELGLDVSSTADISGYTDAAQVSPYALPAVSWAVGTGLMGKGGTALNPLGSANRADIPVMIYRFIQEYNL